MDTLIFLRKALVFEVTPDGETVWKFFNPFKPLSSTPQAAGAAPKRVEPKASSPKTATISTDTQKTPTADSKKTRPAPAAGGGASRTQGNTLFRATRYAPNDPAFASKTLKPGKTLVEIEVEFEKQKSIVDAAARAKTAAASN